MTLTKQQELIAKLVDLQDKIEAMGELNFKIGALVEEVLRKGEVILNLK